jgi:pimeloyl-ACP methyl ester carboxylesterase
VSGIQYERNGIGQSEPDTAVYSDKQVVQRLNRLLKTLNIKPPYLLVGHSIGGAYIRLFAAEYPNEVCGLVFSDPTDFMLTTAENKEAKLKSNSATGYQEVSAISIKSMAENQKFKAGTRYDAMRALKAGYFVGYRDLPPLKNSIAATVIISYNKYIEAPDEELNQTLHLGINFKPWWKEYDNLRIQHYSEMIKDNDNSMIVLLPKYSHGIYFQNPELVAKLILDNYKNYQNKGHSEH